MTYLNTTMNPVGTYQAPQAPAQVSMSLPTATAAQTVASDSFAMSWQPQPSFQANVQFQAPASNYSPALPTLTALSISREALTWATELEGRVAQGYKPTPEETAYYDSLGAQLNMLKQNVQPMSATPALPQIQDWSPAPTQAPGQPAPKPAAGNAFGPGMPAADKQVTMSEIEWSLILEEKVQKYGYKPTAEEELKYQNILARFKTNSEIKMEFLDSLSAQSPWVGANVSSIRYSKIAAAQVSDLIKAIKTGTGSVVGSLKSIGMTALKSTGLSALVSGGFSAVTNGIAYWQGKKTKTQAVSNIVTDTATGAVTGLGATIVGGAAMAALAGTSITGIGLTLLVGGAGMLGGWLADKLFSKSGAKDWIKSKTIAMMDGLGSAKTAAPQSQTQPVATGMPINTNNGNVGAVTTGYPTYTAPQFAY